MLDRTRGWPATATLLMALAVAPSGCGSSSESTSERDPDSDDVTEPVAEGRRDAATARDASQATPGSRTVSDSPPARDGSALAEDLDASILPGSDAGPDAENGKRGGDAGGGDAISDGREAGAMTSSAIGCADTIEPSAERIEALLQRSCGLAASCHAGNQPQAALDLSTLAGVFATAVDVPSSQAATLKLIAPGAPEDSYLIRKIRGSEVVGMKMPPPPAAALCDARLRALEEWIRAGAKR